MNASDLYKAGKLAAATDAQIAFVKAHPADSKARLFLFELALFGGDIDRVTRQADMVKFDEPEINATMDQYRMLIMAEKNRRAAFRTGEKPRSYGPLTEECEQRVQALDLLRNNKPADAAALIEKHPPVAITGTLNGKEFDSFCDCDDVLGPVLEVVATQGYFWVPLAHVASVSALAPKFPRDLFWLPAQLQMVDGQSGPVFLPALYPFSHEHADEEVKLGRKTEWTGGEGSPVHGAGQKTYLAGEDVVGVLDIRELTFNPVT